MSIFYYLLHALTGCKDEDLAWFKDKKATCRKCGRIYFNFMK
jgi:hypothetical protein